MGKTILIAIGFFISFILGSLFTITYVDANSSYKVSEVRLEHGEKPNFTIAPSSSVIISTEKIFEANKGTILREVTVYPAKFIGPTNQYSIEINKQEGLKSLSHFKSNRLNFLNDVKRKERWYPLPSISSINLIEAKARSPGTLIVPLRCNNYINTTAMLRSEKKALRNVIKLIYTTKRYVRIKNNGDIIIKEHWYSQEKIRTTWSNIFNIVVPGIIVSLSKDIAEEYFQGLVELQNNNRTDFQLIKFVESNFADFCLETGFSGKTIIENLEPAYWKKSLIRFSIITDEKIESLKQLNISSIISRYFPAKLNNKKFFALQALPSKSIQSLKEILDNSIGDYNLQSVGLCTSGIPRVDASWPRVFRLTEVTDLI